MLTRSMLQKQLTHILPQIDPQYGAPRADGRGFHGDANETLVFARQLEYVYTKLFETEYPEARWRSLLPVDFSVPSGAQSHTYRMTDDVGSADVIDNYANDAPLVDQTGKEASSIIIPVRDAFFYSIQDLRAAQMAGVDLDVRKAQTARRVMERKLDALAAVGSSRHSMTGAANDANVEVKNTGNLTGLTGTWSTASAAQIIADLQLICKRPFDNTLGIHGNPDNGTQIDLIVPTTVYSTLAGTRTDTFNNSTILTYAKTVIPFLRSITPWAQLNTAGASGVTRIIAGHISPDVLSIVIPQDFETFPIKPKGLGFITDCHARWGGCVVRYPLAMSYIDGM